MTRISSFRLHPSSFILFLALRHFVRQLVNCVGRARKMRCQGFAHFVDGMSDGATIFLFLKMRPHHRHQFLPKFPPAPFMHPHVSHHGILARSRRHENEHAIAIARFLHPQLNKSALRPRQRIFLEIAALYENSNLSRSSPFRFLDCLDDALVIEPLKKSMSAHYYQLDPAPPPPKLPPPLLKPPKPPPPDDPPLDHPPLPQFPMTKGPPNPV
jgi:hypothetical protein